MTTNQLTMVSNPMLNQSTTDPVGGLNLSLQEFETHIAGSNRRKDTRYSAIKLEGTTQVVSPLGTWKSKKTLPDGKTEYCFSEGSVTVPASVGDAKIFKAVVLPVGQLIGSKERPTSSWTQRLGFRKGGRKSRRKSMKKRSTRRRRH